MYTIHFDDRAIDILVKFDKELRKRVLSTAA